MAKLMTLFRSSFAAVIFFSWIALPFIVRPLFIRTTEETVSFTVEKTERVVNSANSDGEISAKYLVFTKSETFEDTDELAYWKFNSSDVYGLLKPGHSYEAKVVGMRNPLFSWYRNILSVKEVSR